MLQLSRASCNSAQSFESAGRFLQRAGGVNKRKPRRAEAFKDRPIDSVQGGTLPRRFQINLPRTLQAVHKKREYAATRETAFAAFAKSWRAGHEC
jgi:hypothetical protein